MDVTVTQQGWIESDPTGSRHQIYIPIVYVLQPEEYRTIRYTRIKQLVAVNRSGESVEIPHDPTPELCVRRPDGSIVTPETPVLIRPRDNGHNEILLKVNIETDALFDNLESQKKIRILYGQTFVADKEITFTLEGEIGALKPNNGGKPRRVLRLPNSAFRRLHIPYLVFVNVILFLVPGSLAILWLNVVHDGVFSPDSRTSGWFFSPQVLEYAYVGAAGYLGLNVAVTFFRTVGSTMQLIKFPELYLGPSIITLLRSKLFTITCIIFAFLVVYFVINNSVVKLELDETQGLPLRVVYEDSLKRRYEVPGGKVYFRDLDKLYVVRVWPEPRDNDEVLGMFTYKATGSGYYSWILEKFVVGFAQLKWRSVRTSNASTSIARGNTTHSSHTNVRALFEEVFSPSSSKEVRMAALFLLGLSEFHEGSVIKQGGTDLSEPIELLISQEKPRENFDTVKYGKDSLENELEIIKSHVTTGTISKEAINNFRSKTHEFAKENATKLQWTLDSLLAEIEHQRTECQYFLTNSTDSALQSLFVTSAYLIVYRNLINGEDNFQRYSEVILEWYEASLNILNATNRAAGTINQQSVFMLFASLLHGVEVNTAGVGAACSSWNDALIAMIGSSTEGGGPRYTRLLEVVASFNWDSCALEECVKNEIQLFEKLKQQMQLSVSEQPCESIMILYEDSTRCSRFRDYIAELASECERRNAEGNVVAH